MLRSADMLILFKAHVFCVFLTSQPLRLQVAHCPWLWPRWATWWWWGFEAVTQCLLCMRPLCERGKDSISEQTSHPRTQSGQYSGPAAREPELIVWLENPPLPLTSSLFSSLLVCFLRHPLLSPPACLWPSYPTLFLQPFHCPVIKVLLPLAFLECACKAYCFYAKKTVTV